MPVPLIRCNVFSLYVLYFFLERIDVVSDQRNWWSCVSFRAYSKSFKQVYQVKRSARKKRESLKSLGEVIKRHRAAHKMPQDFVAEYLGVSRQAVSKWENGASDPSTANLIALARLFDTTPEELLKEIER